MIVPLPIVVGLPLTGFLGFGLLWLLADRATDDRHLRRVVLASYGLRVFLALAFYATSYWALPILRSQQRSGGFWGFGVDAWVYHFYGTRIAEAWAKGIELPDPGFGFEYFALVAAVYRFFGSHPLYLIMLNSWLAALNGLLAYLIGRRLTDRRTAFVGAALVAFWPSSFLWSTQLMKDALSWSLVLFTLWLMMSLIPHTKRPPRSFKVWGGLCTVLIVTVIALTLLRFYLGLVLSFTAITVVMPAAITAFFQRRVKTGVQCVSLVVLVVFCMLFARTLNPLHLLSPSHPERGHFRLATQLWQKGQLGPAEDEFQQAINLNRKYMDAYLGLAVLEIERGDLNHALQVYNDYLEQEESQRRQQVKKFIERIYVNHGDRELAAGRFLEATSSYKHVAQTKQEYQRRQITQEKIRQMSKTPPPAVASTQPASAEHASADAQPATSSNQPASNAMSKTPPPETSNTQPTSVEHAAAYAQPAPSSNQRIRLTQEKIRLMSKTPPPETSNTQPTSVEHAAAYAQPAPSSNHPASSALTLQELPHVLTSNQLVDAELITIAHQVFHFMPGKEVMGRAEPSRATGWRWLWAENLSQQLDEQAAKTIAWTKPNMLGSVRHDIVSVGGNAVMDPQVLISNPHSLMTYLPRALAIGFLAPFPWQWFDTRGTTGGMRPLTSIDMLLIYFLLPSIIVGMWRSVKSPRVDRLFLLVFILGTAVPISLVVANLGTLFRLRLLFLLPLLIIAAQGDVMGPYRRLLYWLASRMQGDVARGRTQEPMMTRTLDTSN